MKTSLKIRLIFLPILLIVLVSCNETRSQMRKDNIADKDVNETLQLFYDKSIEVFEKEGRFDKAAQVAEQKGLFDEAGILAEAIGDFDKAIYYYEKAGWLRDATRVAEAKKNIEKI